MGLDQLIGRSEEAARTHLRGLCRAARRRRWPAAAAARHRRGADDTRSQSFLAGDA